VWGAAVFAVGLAAPGYVAGWALDIADFRRRSAVEQTAWSLALSMGIGTVLIVAGVWASGVAAVGFLLAAVNVVAVVLWLRSRVPAGRISLRAVALAGGWTLLVVLSLADVGVGSRLWMSVTTYDHSVRTALVDAVMRTGVVPVNPLYWPGHDAALRYYYFWYVTCAVIAKLAHISARQAFIASCVWPAFAVVGMLALYGKYVLEWTGKELRLRTRICVVLLAVTGLDALVTLFNWLAGGATPGDMEWWSIDQVTSWLDTFLWVPHHAAALVCCLLSFLLLWMARAELRRRQRVAFAVVAGLSFASAFGLSTYVAIGFSLVMAAWLVRLIFARMAGARKVFAATGVAVMVAGLVLSPYVAQLLRKGPGDGTGAQHVLTLEVRQMLDPAMLANAPGMVRLAAAHPFAQTQLAALILLLPGYGVELGFFALAAVLAMRLPPKTEGERTLLFLFFASLVSVSFLRSAVIATNDYGVRASMIAQFFAVLLAVRVWETSRGRRRNALLGLAIVGVCGTVYQAVALRVFLPWQQLHGNPAMRDLAERNDALREAYAAFDQRAPRSARVQYDDSAGGYFDYTQMLHAQRQIVVAGTGCRPGFGGEMAPCERIARDAEILFPKTGGKAVPSETAISLCRDAGIEYLVATRWDGVWSDTGGWPWQLPAVAATPDVRIVACSPR
jgi:hypothetical protein